MPGEQCASRAMALMLALAMPSRAITRQVADKISSRRSSQLTIFGITAELPDGVLRPPSVFLSDVRLTSPVMYPSAPDGLGPARTELVRYGNRLLADGLSVGSAGNLSVRAGDTVAITPSGVASPDLRPADFALVTLDGAPLADGEAGRREAPSSETPMHLAIYAATSAAAVVHTHSPEVIALSAARSELPAIHYAITGLGGPVRVAPYVRFGSEGLAAAAVEALAGRSAVILQNHGAITWGRSLTEAYDRALPLESLNCT